MATASLNLTPDSLYRIKEFLEKFDIPVAGRGLDSTIPELINREVLVSVVQLPNKREPGKFYNAIDTLGARL